MVKATLEDLPTEVEREKAAQLSAIGFIGQVLSPFWLQDPQLGSASEAFGALSVIDPIDAGAEWPFVDDSLATRCLLLMKDGILLGASSLGEEFRRLFVGPYKKVAPPWGSVYTDKDCVIFGESMLSLREWMRENGIRRISSGKDPDDHIGLLLALLPWLVEEKPELVSSFLRDHVLTWSSHFFDLVASETRQPFYNGLANLTKSSLEGIQKTLNLVVTYPRFYR